VWAPFHLWSAAGRPEGIEPLELEAVRDGGGQPGLRVWAGLPEGGLRLGEPLKVDWLVANPFGQKLRNFVLELSGVEHTRHLAATDDYPYWWRGT